MFFLLKFKNFKDKFVSSKMMFRGQLGKTIICEKNFYKYLILGENPLHMVYLQKLSLFLKLVEKLISKSKIEFKAFFIFLLCLFCYSFRIKG